MERRGVEKEKGLFDLLDGGFCEVRDSGQVGGFDCEIECDVDVSLDDVMVETDEGSWDGHLWICYGVMFAVLVIGGGDDAEAGWMMIARLGRHLC